MRSHLAGGTAALLLTACAGFHRPAPAPAPVPAPLAPDFAAVDAWIACRAQGTAEADCDRRAGETEGGRLAELARGTFGPGAPPPQPARDPAAIGALVARMRAWPASLDRAAELLPSPPAGEPVRLYVVATGHPWGDAYVRGVSGRGPQVRLADDGAPVIVLNAGLIAGTYGATAAEQAEAALGIVTHEVFHVLFARHRAQAAAWGPLRAPSSARAALSMVVLDEGVAHWIEARDRLAREGFPADRAAAALGALAAAWTATEGQTAAQAEATLAAADTGRYWDKYGAISGMLLAHGVFRASGVEGLRDALRCGPGRLLTRYRAARVTLPELPALPPALDGAGWVDLCP